MAATSPIMKCGCVAQGTCSASHGQRFDPPIPSCVVHDCLEIAEQQPDLTGRFAACTYKCGSRKPSSPKLAFFVFKGEGSAVSREKCKCGFLITAHWPRWSASIRVIRRWFKIERSDQIEVRGFNAPNELKHEAAEREADFFRQMQREETRVFSATVESIRPVKSRIKCHEFVAAGPFAEDEYYCGCRGWD